MIENYANIQTQQTAQTQRVLTYVKNDRMGGSIPKYETVQASDANIAQNIETSLYDAKDESALAYQPTRAIAQGKDQFGFGDLVDMINPLHHVPVVGHFYREMTGDQIKPISRIMGGAAFSGPFGVASALIDTVAVQETGKDMTGNTLAFAFSNREKTTPIPPKEQNPQQSIEKAMDIANDPAATSALLSFSDLGAKDEAKPQFENYKRPIDKTDQSLEHEPITQLSFSEKGGLYAL